MSLFRTQPTSAQSTCNCPNAFFRFMGLDVNQFGYFVQQVGLSAASFGVAAADVNAVGAALYSLFGYRCSSPMTVVPGDGPQTQAICSDPSCPLADDPKCWLYIPPYTPAPASSSSSAAPATSTYAAKSSKYQQPTSSACYSSKYESSSSSSSSPYHSSSPSKKYEKSSSSRV